MPSYNNSFEALLKDLKRYKKNGSRGAFVMCIPDAGEASGSRSAGAGSERFYSEDPDREVLPGETELFTDMWKRVLNTQC